LSENRVRVGIIGITGHTGQELLYWLLSHSKVELVYLMAREVVDDVRKIYPWVDRKLEVEQIDVDKLKLNCDCVFLALPHTVSQEFVPRLLSERLVVVDLSADYRFKDVGIYEKYYNVKHTSPQLLSQAVYGLPEVYREQIRSARLIANPGCYPTSVILGLYPLAKRGLISRVIVDAKSGASGAGKKLKKDFLFASLVGNLYPYKPNIHQHIPEILSHIDLDREKFVFVPHLVGIERGIISTMYVDIRQDLSEKDIWSLYQEIYGKEIFIRLVDNLPSYRSVLGTNQCHITIRLLGKGQVLVVSAIDNLVKGASGQAIQNMNLAFGIDEKEGLR